MSAKMVVAVSAMTDLLTAAVAFSAQAERISRMIAAAQQAGRDDLTAEDWAAIHAQHAAARAALAQALADGRTP